MDFQLSEEQQLFQESVRKFARRHLTEGALRRAHLPEFPFEESQLMAKQGLLGLTFDEANGGSGGTVFDAVLAIQEIALVCPRSADVFQAGNFGPIRTFAEYATPEQKVCWLPRLLAGELVISLCMSEPEAGSAVTDLQTSATPEGNGFRVNGTKVFSSHSPEAELFLVYVRYGPGVEGIGSVLIPRGAEGFTIGKPTRYVGGDDWCQLYFDNVYVPPEDVLLREGGFRKQILGFNVERIGNSSRALALGRYAYEVAREHAMTRNQFGRPLCEFQGLQWKFADMKINLDAGQLLLYRAAANADNGFPSAMETSIAKAFCNRAGFETASEAMQILGGAGYSQDSLVEYCFRRTRGWMIAGGSPEMMKNRIAESIFERRFSQRPPMSGP